MAIAGAQILLLCCDFLSQSNNSLNSISGIPSFSAIILTKKRPTPAETNLQSLFGKDIASGVDIFKIKTTYADES